jgi:hypothetical protein
MNDSLLDDYRRHLESEDYCHDTIRHYQGIARRFLKFVDKAFNRITEADVQGFLAAKRYKTKSARLQAVVAVTQLIKFAAASLPVVVGRELPPPAPSKKAVAMRQKWALEKLVDEKEKADDLIATLARRVIDHYVYFGKRLKGEPDDLDELARFADDCREIIERNLPLFMGLSAGGRNLHPAVDERIIK